MKKHTVQPIKDIKDIEKINKYLKENNYKGYVLWQTGLNTGLRVIDIIRLNVGDVANKKYLNVIEQKTQKTKRFPIVDNLQKILNDYCKGRSSDEPLFTNQFNKKRLNRKTAWRFIVEGCKKAGISENVGTHTMRKTFGYHHYKQFHDAVILQKIFNHSSLRITLIYIGVEQDEIDASYNSFTYKVKKKEPKVSIDTDIKKSIEKLTNICQKLENKISEKSTNKVIVFLKNYLNNGGIKHKEFAELALSYIGAEE